MGNSGGPAVTGPTTVVWLRKTIYGDFMKFIWNLNDVSYLNETDSVFAGTCEVGSRT